MLETLESVETSNQRETSLDSSSGQNISEFNAKREFSSKDSRFPPPSINSKTQLIKTKVGLNYFLFESNLIFISIASQLLKLLSKYSPETKREKKNRLLKEAEASKDKKDAKKDDKAKGKP